MAIYLLDGNKLKPVAVKKIDLEKNVQKLTEENLDIIFGLKFISGSLNSEFSVRAQEQDFYIDTLAFDEEQKSFVIIEYKKDKSFSVIDQGFAYLSAMLNHKADFILELNEKLDKRFTKNDIDWEQSRVIFISPEFTNYQKNAINFKDLPIFLYEAKLYENDLFDFNPIKPYRTTESIGKLTGDKTIQAVTKEVKVYTIDDLIDSKWNGIRNLFGEFDHQIKNNDIETKIKFTKVYIAYMSKHGRNYVELVPQQKGIKVYFRFPANSVKSSLKIEDISHKGHLVNGISYVHLDDSSQIPEAIRLAKESFHFLHKDIYK